MASSEIAAVPRLLSIMEQLRDKEKGCPWDIEQTFTSIAPHTLEEAYEVVEAIEKNDKDNLKEELGDLLLQVVFHAQMAKEEGIFTFKDVVETLNKKLIARHPHVFGEEKIATAAAQAEAWEQHKKKEKASKSQGFMRERVLADVPMALPALSRALKLQKKAEKVGFDWAKLEFIFDKLEEEIGELQTVLKTDKGPQAILEEIGDMIFCCVNLARKLSVDPEAALRFCNHKFESRFAYMEAELDVQQRNISDVSLQELNDLWDQAKIAEQSEVKVVV